MRKHDLRGNMMRRRTMDADIDEVYAFERALGHGSMGAVASIRKKDTNQIYALKTIQLNRINKEMRDELRNEIDILMGLDHPNIIRPLELFERKRQMYFVMEMCSGGDLFERSPYSEKQAALYTNQICSAVRYLHMNNICHRSVFEADRGSGTGGWGCSAGGHPKRNEDRDKARARTSCINGPPNSESTKMK